MMAHSKPSLSHVCKNCGSIGLRCITQDPEPASAAEIDTAKQVGRLLAVPDSVAKTWDAQTLKAGVRAMVDAAYGGQVVRASREAGLSRSSVCSWASGKLRPNLAGLLQMALYSGTDIVEIFGGRAVLRTDEEGKETRTAATPRKLVRRGYRRIPESVDIAAALRAAALEHPPPGLREFCDRHQTSPRNLRLQWPELTDALFLAAASHRKHAGELHAAQTLAAYERSAIALVQEGNPVTSKLLQRTARLVAFSHNQERVRAVRAVVDRYAHSAVPPS